MRKKNKEKQNKQNKQKIQFLVRAWDLAFTTGKIYAITIDWSRWVV